VVTLMRVKNDFDKVNII